MYWSAARELARPIRSIAGHAVLIAGVLGLVPTRPRWRCCFTAEPDWGYAYLVRMDERSCAGWLAPGSVLLVRQRGARTRSG